MNPISTATDGEALLQLLKAEPTLMAPAPADFPVQHINHRRLNEDHPCLRCGQKAYNAFIAETRIGPRWLDLCAPCRSWARI